MLQTAFTTPTQRTYTFQDLPSLHKFQEVLTGQRVRFDGLAERVSISRKRTGSMMPGLSKRNLEARQVRVQIVRGLSGSDFGGAPTSQILLFFDHFPAADAMNFLLRPTDAYERVDGKHAPKDKDRDRDRDRDRVDSRENSPALGGGGGGGAGGGGGGGDGRFGVRLVDAKFSLPNADFEEKEKERKKERERAERAAEKEGRADVKRDSGGREKERDRDRDSASKWRMSRSGNPNVAAGGSLDPNAYADTEELGRRAQELGLDVAVGIGGGRDAEALRRRFVCLDELEFAEMHDDVFVGFGSEQGESSFLFPSGFPSVAFFFEKLTTGFW